MVKNNLLAYSTVKILTPKEGTTPPPYRIYNIVIFIFLCKSKNMEMIILVELSEEESEKVFDRWEDDCDSGEEIIPDKDELKKRLLVAREMVDIFTYI